MLCKDLDIYGYKPTLSKPGLGQGHKWTQMNSKEKLEYKRPARHTAGAIGK